MADNYLITGYWGEPHVTAENDRGINAAIFGPGRFVLPVGEQFRAEYIGNNTIRVYDGKLVDNGAAGGIPAGKYVDLMISEAGQGMNRNDLIVFQYEKNTSTLVESGKFIVVKGAETSGTAADPALKQADLLSDSATFDQMALWRVPISTATISAPVQVFTVLNNLQGVKSSADSKAPKSHASTGTTYGVSSASNYGHAKASGTTPKAPGTASTGSETGSFARGDHVHPEQVSAHGVTTAGSGAAYTATVEGITALVAGASFIMLPHTASTTEAPTLNVNGLGAKVIRRGVCDNSITTVASTIPDWLGINKPVRVTYNGLYWVADLPKPNVTEIIDELLNMHIWYKCDGDPSLIETEATDVTISYYASASYNPWDIVQYSDTITVRGGVISLVNPKSITANNSADKSVLVGKYIYTNHSSEFMYIPEDATVNYQQGATGSTTGYVKASKAIKLSTVGKKVGFAASEQIGTYPTNGEHTDGYWYVYNKQLGD